MTPNNFRVKSGLTVGTTISGGNTTITGSISVSGLANVSSLIVGGTTLNSTTFAGTANNASFLGGTAASGYQTTAGLSANVATLTSNNSTNLGGSSLATIQGQITGNAATAYTNATAIAANGSNITSGTVAFARLPALYLGTTTIQSTSAAQAVSGITTLATGNTTITGFANVTSTIQGGSSLTIAGAASGITTLAAGNTTITGFVNATSSVNAASHTVGSSFVANSTGTTVNVASWGATFRASNSTNFSGIRWDDTGGTIRAGMYRYDNSDLTLSIYDNTGTFQAAPVIISASTGTVTLSRLATTNGVFSGAVSGITTLAAGNTTVTGFANVTSTLQVGGISTFSGNVVLGSVGVSANGGFGTAGQVLHSNGTATYWAADDNSGGTVTSIATANGLSGGTITTSGTLGVTTGSTLTVNTAGIHVNSALSIASLALSGDLTVSGNLTVSGTRTYVNTTTLDIGDNIITLNADLGASAPSQNAGIEIMRGTSANVQFLWDETNDRWSTNGQPIAVSSLVAAGAASGITTLAAGNTTITGFANVISTIQGGSSLAIAGALSGVTTAAMGNTTITGFANVTTSIQGGSSLTIAGAASGITTLAAGNTTITGFANVTSTLQVGGVSTFAANANFDSGVLFVDGTNNRVGINTTTPQRPLHAFYDSAVVGAYTAILQGAVGGYGAGVSFQSQLTGGALAEMARITGDGDSSWNTTASTQDASLRFYTALDGTVAEKMRINSAGQVGIGNTTPSHLLSVQGTAALGNTTITGFANVTSTIQGGSSLTIAGALSGVTTAAMGNTTITGFANVTTSIQGGSSLTIAGAASGITTLAAGNTTITGFANVTSTLQVGGVATFAANANFDSGVLFVDGVNNLVGVGTTAPGTKLDVNGSIRSRGDNSEGGQLELNNPDNSAVGAYLDVSSADVTRWFTVRNNTLHQIGQLSGTGGSVTLYTEGAERLRAVANGNIGIGTTTPGYKLEVSGSFAATTKSFIIPHPTKPDMKLRYGSLEGPENGVYVRGRLRAGETIIRLPDYWEGLVDDDTYTVNLTPVGKHQELYVEHIASDHIVVGGENIDCFYTVFAERNDVEKLVVEF